MSEEPEIIEPEIVKLREIEPIDPVKQKMYRYKGRVYSVVDLRIPPLEANGTRAGGRFIDIMHNSYYPYCFEIADMSAGIVPLERVKSFEAARRWIKNNR